MKARIPQGMGGGPQNMNTLMRQMQKFNEEREALTEELESREYEINAGGGAVTVRISGKKEILSVSIDHEVVDPDDVETLEDIIVAGVNEAIKTAENAFDSEMSALTRKYGIPDGAL